VVHISTDRTAVKYINLRNCFCHQSTILSLLSGLTGKLQDIEYCKMKECTVEIRDRDSHTADAVSSENTKNITDDCKHADHSLPTSPTVEEHEKMIATEVLAEDKLDHGYSWVIVCASFVNCFIVGIMFIGFSILYVEITEFFGSSKGVAGWIGSLYMASGSIFGEKFHNSLSFHHHCIRAY